MDDNEIRLFIEAALLAAGRPLSVDQIHGLFEADAAPEKPEIRKAIKGLIEEYEARGITIVEVASGFRLQIKSSMAERLHRLWEERPPRYSRALFETLALIAYRQPITRGEIEEIRGVSVSTNIIRSMLEREWVRVVGHRDVPGRPAMFGTTKQFLDYFGLKKLDDLPPLADLADWETLRIQLNLPAVEEEPEDEAVTAVITDLPIPGRFDDADEHDDAVADRSGSAAVEAEDAEAELLRGADTVTALTEERGFEEIVATEWPEPVDAAEPEPGDLDTDKDIDVSASGG